MVRMAIHLDQHISILPIIEVVMDIYHDNSEEAKPLADLVISETVNMIEKITDFCRGKFCNLKPRSRIDKDAQMGVRITIALPDMESIKLFEGKLKKMLD